MPTQHIALVPEIGVNASDLARVSAALQRQVTRDLGPIWGITATVDAFPQLEDVPAGYWPLILTFRDLGPEAGIHLDRNGQPFGLIEMSPSWSLTASHLCLEMLSNPFGNRTFQGPSPRPDQGEVEYLAQICGPCEHPQFAYIINDVLVSDFCTPAYWERGSRDRYSLTGAVQAPLQILPGGHLSWYDPTTNTWWTRRHSNNAPSDSNLGCADPKKGTVREFVSAHTPHHLLETKMTVEAFEARMGVPRHRALQASQSRAYWLRSSLGVPRGTERLALEDVQAAVKVVRPRGDLGGRPQVLAALLRASLGPPPVPALEPIVDASIPLTGLEPTTSAEELVREDDLLAAPETAPENQPRAPEVSPTFETAPSYRAASANAAAAGSAPRTVPPPLPRTAVPPAPSTTASSPVPSLGPSIPPVAHEQGAPVIAGRSRVFAVGAIAAAVALAVAAALQGNGAPESAGVSAAAPGMAESPVPRAIAPATPSTPAAAATPSAPAAAATPPATASLVALAASTSVPAPLSASAREAAPTPRPPPPTVRPTPRLKPATATASRAARPDEGQSAEPIDTLVDDRR